MKVNVNSIHFHADSKLITYIERKLSRLSRFFDRISEAEVSLKLQDTGGRVREKTAEIHLRMPNGWVIDRKTGDSFEMAVNASVDTLKRQVSKHKLKMANHAHDKIGESIESSSSRAEPENVFEEA